MPASLHYVAMPSRVELHDLSSPHLPAPVPYAVLTPGGQDPLPLCIFLLGGGGTRESVCDPELWQSNNPANRARANANQIRESALAIYIDAAGHDFLNAHDGAEFLHRTLWDLDLSHEYHLIRNADHGGPTMRPRLRAMFTWIGDLLNPPPVDEAAEQAATLWLESGMQGKPPAGATTTNAFIRFLRARYRG